MRKKAFKIVASLLLIIVVGLLVFLKTATYTPNQTLSSVQQKYSEVTITEQSDAWQLLPKKSQATAVIFYPGALVEETSYLALGAKLADAGYPVYIAKMPLNLAILKQNVADDIIADNNLNQFVIGGHSLGGVMASRFANKTSQPVQGVFYLASYPDEKGEIVTKDLPALSVYGELDTVINLTSFEKAKQYLPTHTFYEVIAGGNHAGFGDYGPQKKDTPTTLLPDEQQNMTVSYLIEWLNELTTTP